ncbi:hypothetical protein OS122_02385 [Mycolicibacterium mucogenicum]|uniref:hypothetical protein n=1 Tax=Mycolicibacterium mucogenicum TaxID=56689 RepID=UPI00226A0520|nr:hypothetical protein [Mycolicibacterium mucogenicum]MCX8559746.1 hypothetical protein [Mycolicibacterium mucogenicum]
MIALLFLVGFIGLHWKLIATVIALVLAWRYGRRFYDEQLAAQSAAARRRAEVSARADVQHAEVLRGDGHGTYGSAWPTQQKFDELAA